MPTIKDLAPQLNLLLAELDRRKAATELNRRHARGAAPMPQAVIDSKLTRAYAALMGMSAAPWGGLIVDSVQDRLEVGGIRTGDEQRDRALWERIWQPNGLDAEAKLAQHSVLRDGRAFATIWPDERGEPEIVYDGADQVVVAYIEGRHKQRHRIAALRRWIDGDGVQNVTLYRPNELFKLRESRDQVDAADRVRAGEKWWEPREETGPDGLPEPWPLPNPYGVVPVVELSTNRELQPGPFPYARGEFEHCHGLLDRINLLTFLGLVVAVWMGFPLRGVIGETILRDDDGNELPPFDSRPGEVATLENPKAQTFEFEAADRGNLSIFAELAQLAYVTKTPAHYFPMQAGLSNISADTIRALEGALHAKVRGIHKPQIGEGHEEVVRVAALMLEDPIEVPASAEVVWLDHESRSMAERADAAAKLKELLPAEFIAEKYLGFTQQELGRVRAGVAGTAFDRLLSDALAGGATAAAAADAAVEVA